MIIQIKVALLACVMVAMIVNNASAVGNNIFSTSGLSCSDKTERFEITSVTIKNTSRSCKWVKRKSTENRCKIAEAKMNCRNTCNNCCADSTQKFFLNGKRRGCNWVKRKPNKIEKRCGKTDVTINCPDTCSHLDCTMITPAPTAAPTAAPIAQDNTPSAAPSRPPSPLPSPFPTLRPTSEPSDAPSENPSDEPSRSPSTIPSDQPSQDPSTFPSDQPSSLPSDQPSQEPSSFPSDEPSSLVSTTVFLMGVDLQTRDDTNTIFACNL